MKKLLAGLLSLVMTTVVVAMPLGENNSNNWVNISISANAKSPKKVNYKPYKSIINSYQKKYGKARQINKNWIWLYKGVCYAKLIDFNKDGKKELVINYNTPSKKSMIKYNTAIYTLKSGKAKKIFSGSYMPDKSNIKKVGLLAGNEACCAYLSIVKKNNTYYYVTGIIGYYNEFHFWKYDGKKFKDIKSVAYDPMYRTTYINGKKRSGKKYKKEYDSWYNAVCKGMISLNTNAKSLNNKVQTTKNICK